MTSRGFLGWLAAIIATSLSGQAFAQTQYTDPGAFTAASQPTTLVDFNSSALGSFPTGTSFGDFTITFSSPGSVSGAIANGGSYNVNGSNFLDLNINPGASLSFTFNAPITSFGANFTSLNNSTPRTFVNIDGANFNPLPDGTPFLGYVSSTPFTQVTFAVMGGGSNDEFGLDNLQFAVATPEPASWAMMIGGFGFVGGALRKRRRAGVLLAV